jgi:probable HAF family extracellular repeat protein
MYTVTDLGSLAGPTSGADFVNNNGWVAGQADDDPVLRYAHAWVWTGSGALQNLGSFGGPQSVSFPTGLNDNGWVVGESDISTGGATHGFLWTGGGTIQDIGGLGGMNTLPTGINNLGEIVGGSQVSGGTYHGFTLRNGIITDLGPIYVPTAINSSGQLAGNIEPADGNPHDIRAFMSSGGTYVDLGTLGGTFSQPNALNDNGVVVGASFNAAGRTHAFMYATQMVDLGTLGGLDSAASGINSAGVIVGASDIDTAQHSHAFIYGAGTGMVDLNTLINPMLGWDIESASDINNIGQIAASGTNRSGQEHAVLLTPIDVPEPKSALLAAVASIVPLALVFYRHLRAGNLHPKRGLFYGGKRNVDTGQIRESNVSTVGSDGERAAAFLRVNV